MRKLNQNKYCVFAHKGKKTGTLFCVGYGLEHEAFHHGQDMDWIENNSAEGGFDVLFIVGNITKQKAKKSYKRVVNSIKK